MGAFAKNVITEGGWEEMGQASVSKAAGLYYKNLTYPEYENYDKEKEGFIATMNAIGKGYSDTFSDFANYEDFFFGGLIGAGGIVNINRNSSGKIGLAWQGGVFEAIQERNAENAALQQLAEQFNEKTPLERRNN